MAENLTVWDAVALGEIVGAAVRKSRVARVMGVELRVGYAQCVSDSIGNHSRSTDDVRDLYLRVTLAEGFDAFWPIRELIAEYRDGEFMANYVPIPIGG